MSFMKRAFKSILRQPSKSLILLVTIAILGTLIAGAVSIRQGLVGSQKMMSDKMKVYAYILPQGASADGVTVKEMSQLPALDADTIDKIASLPQVKGYETTDYVVFSTGKLVSDILGAGTSRPAIFKVTAAKNGNLLDYASGNLTIVKGRWLTAEDENSAINPIVIAESVAQKNRLAVGSQITLTTSMLDSASLRDAVPDDSYLGATETTFTIVGTYGAADQYVAGSDGQLESVSSYLNLNMYTTAHSLDPVIAATREKALESNPSYSSGNGGLTTGRNAYYALIQAGFSAAPSFTLWLDSRDSADAFVDAVNGVGLPSKYIVTVSTAAYDQTMSPLKNLSWIVDLIIIAAVAVTIVILGLVVMLMLRTRRTEMGTLYSLGERKRNIAAQVVAEVLLVAVIGLTVSVFVGNKLAGGISDQLVQGEVSKLLESGGGAGVDATALHDMTEDNAVKLDGATVGWIYLAGLLTAGVSALIPVVLTLRRPPKQIMT